MAEHRTIEDQKTEGSTLLGSEVSGNATDERHDEAPRVRRKRCKDWTAAWFQGHWREWHRGHGCHLDDGKAS